MKLNFAHCMINNEGSGYSLDTPVDLEIWKLMHTPSVT